MFYFVLRRINPSPKRPKLIKASIDGSGTDAEVNVPLYNKPKGLALLLVPVPTWNTSKLNVCNPDESKVYEITPFSPG
jgi:hypothetical protein